MGLTRDANIALVSTGMLSNAHFSDSQCLHQLCGVVCLPSHRSHLFLVTVCHVSANLREKTKRVETT